MSLDEPLNLTDATPLVRNTLARVGVRTARDLFDVDLLAMGKMSGIGKLRVKIVEDLRAEAARQFPDMAVALNEADPANLPVPPDVVSLIMPFLARNGIDRLGRLAEIDLAAARCARGVGSKKWVGLRDAVNKARSQLGVAGPLDRALGDWEGRQTPWSDHVQLPAELIPALKRAKISTLEALASALDAGIVAGDRKDVFVSLPPATLLRLSEEIRHAPFAEIERAKLDVQKEANRPSTFAALYEAVRQDVSAADWPALLHRARGGSLRQAGQLLGVTGERIRQRSRTALDGIDPSLRQAAAELLVSLEEQLTNRAESLDDVLEQHGLDSVAAFGFAHLLVDRDLAQVRYGVITLNPLPLNKLRSRLLGQIREAGSQGRAPKDLNTSGIIVSEAALEQLLGEDVTVLDNGALRHIEVDPSRADRYAQLLLEAGRPLSIAEVRRAAGERDDLPQPATIRSLTTHNDIVAIDRGSYTHRTLLGWSEADVLRQQLALVKILDGSTSTVEPDALLTMAQSAGFTLPGLNRHAVLSIAARHPDVARVGGALAHRRTLDPTQLSLLSRFPEIAEEWHPAKNGDLEPAEVRPFGNTVAWWLCPKGHSYQRPVVRRVLAGRGCPSCPTR